jgi:hypothetical protein
MPDRRQSSGVLTELALYAVSALISFALLNNVLKKLDPNQQNSKQARWPRACHFSRLCGGEAAAPVALQRLSRVSRRTQATAKRKEISARLGRPVLETNQYEDVRLQTLRLSPPDKRPRQAGHANESRQQFRLSHAVRRRHVDATGVEDNF